VTRKHEVAKESQDSVPVAMAKPKWISQAGPLSSVYANQVEMHTSNWDVKIRFGEAIIAEGEHVVEEKARIVMSPQHTKAFLAVLTDTVRRYEAAFGEIPLSPQAARVAKSTEKPQ
jgi:regulator of RNase E activity RraA